MRTKEKQRIVKITEYPETPEKNTVEISNAKKTFAEIQQEENDLLKDNIYEESQKREDEDKKVIVRIEKTEEKIETEVIDRQNENRELSSKISQTAHKIELTATGGDKTIGIVIRLYDEMEI